MVALGGHTGVGEEQEGEMTKGTWGVLVEGVYSIYSLFEYIHHLDYIHYLDSAGGFTGVPFVKIYQMYTL